jgi:hypothetical protein
MRDEQLSLFEDKYDRIDNLVDESFWMYHAGMADGDGCFKYRNKSKKDSLVYQLRLIDKNIIQEISDLYETKITLDKKVKKHHCQRYVTTLNGSNAIHFYKKVYPYLIEKRKKVEEMSEKFIKLERFPVSQDARFMWLAGYFDAEGSITVSNEYNKKSNNYNIKMIVRLTSTDLKVLRFASKLLNRWFNSGKTETIIGIHIKKKYAERHKKCYDLRLSQMTKIHLFAKVFLPFIKVQRKIKKFKKVINYAHFCAWQKWQFGRINFKKNTELRKRWLKAHEVE